MERREDTPLRCARRRYECRKKEERRMSNGTFGTCIPRSLRDEINEFLEANGITKVALVKAGYEVLKKQVEDGTLCEDAKEPNEDEE